MNCSNDDFIRTTEPRHYRASRRSGSGWPRPATSIPTNIPAGTRCATKRSTTRARPSSMSGGAAHRAAGHAGRVGGGGELLLPPVRLSGQAARSLRRRIPDFVLPRERLNEVASFVRGGLKDLSISRTTFDWGIPVPGDPKHVMYVWVDALTNYITAVGYPDTESAKFRRYWPADAARDRQGHRALPRRLLAGLPDVGRHRGAAADLLARLSVQPR